MIVEENKYRFKLELDVATGIESFPMLSEMGADAE